MWTNNGVHWKSTQLDFFLALLQNWLHSSLKAYQTSQQKKNKRNGQCFDIQRNKRICSVRFFFFVFMKFWRKFTNKHCCKLPHDNHWFHFKCRIFARIVLVVNCFLLLFCSRSARVLRHNPINNNKWFYAFIFNYHRNLGVKLL